MCSQIHNSSRASDEGQNFKAGKDIGTRAHFAHLQVFLVLMVLTALGLRDCLVEPEPNRRATTVMGIENTSKGNCK